MFGSWVLNEIWNIDLSSALVGMLMSSSKLFLFFKRSSFKLRCETVIGISLCYSHQACCLILYYLCEINNGIHIYQFTFDLLHFCLHMCLWFRIWTKILADQRIWWKKDTERRVCIPLFTPLLERRLEILLPRRLLTRTLEIDRNLLENTAFFIDDFVREKCDEDKYDIRDKKQYTVLAKCSRQTVGP